MSLKEDKTPLSSSEAEGLAQENLEKSIMSLIDDDPYYAELLLNFRRFYTTKVPTLGVNVTDEINLYVNPYFFNDLTKQGRVAVLKHECLHVIHNHFERFLDLEPKFYDKERTNKERREDALNASLLNKAADYAINEYIRTLPEKVNMFDQKGNQIVFPDKMPDGSPNPMAGKPVKGELLFVRKLKQKIKGVEHERTMEEYYEILKEEQEKQKGQQGQCGTCGGKGSIGGNDKDGKGQKQQSKDGGNGKNDQQDQQDQQQGQGNGQGQPQQGQGQGGGSQPCPDCHGQGGMVLDDHGIWFEGEQNPDAVTEKVKEVVNKAAEDCQDRKAGSIPGEILEAIDKLNHVPKDWRQDVQRFVARSAEILVESTRKKRNRRYGTLYPGIKTFPKLHIVTVFDSSASVQGEELNQFWAEMARLHKMEIKLTVIECDSKVQAVYEFDPKRKPEIYGRGGTAFIPAFEEAKKHDPDGLIYFTDGENWEGDELKKPKFPVLWAILKGYKSHYDWGAKTTIEVRKRSHR